MLNRYPLWKYLLIVAVLVVSAICALPNLFGEDPAIQVSGIRGATVDKSLEEKVLSALKSAGIQPKRAEITVSQTGGSQLLVRFDNEEQQLRGQDVMRDTVGSDYVVALNLAPAIPSWLAWLPVQPMYLGLDLRGGVHFLMEVDMKAAVDQAEQRYVSDVRTLLRDKRIRYQSVTFNPNRGVVAEFRDPAVRNQARDVLHAQYSDLKVEDAQVNGQPAVRMTLTEVAARQVKSFALDQNITTLRNRVNELGVAEPVIQQQGQDRIVVELPGVQDTARAKEILGATATLEFRMVDETHDVQAAVNGHVPIGSKLYYDRQGRPILLKKDVMLTGDYITDAASGLDQQSGSPAVFITLDGKGARIFSERTRSEIGHRMAVVFIEKKTETRTVNGQQKKVKRDVAEVINVAVIRDQLGKRFQITGLDSTEEARNLALLLRAGSLAAPMDIVEERTVGPSLGKANIDQGFESVVAGFVLVLIFMGVYYRLFGLVANLALAFNVVIVIALLSLLQATLTLPGIAGILLTVGMAVDANVLINERIREELRNGNTPQNSIHRGYEKALGTIADANITTFIAGIVLFGLGTGPVKGFAVTLSLGILTSMFTAIMGTRAVINLIYGGRRVSKVSI